MAQAVGYLFPPCVHFEQRTYRQERVTNIF